MWHQESRPEGVGLNFLPVCPNARNIITAVNSYGVIYNQPALVHLHVAYFMGDGEPLTSPARPSVNTNYDLIATAEGKAGFGSLEMLAHN